MPISLGTVGGAPVLRVELDPVNQPGTEPALADGAMRIGSPFAPSLQLAIPANLPATVELGATTIHRYRDPRIDDEITISVFAPLSNAEGWLINGNAKPFGDRYPQRFVIGDGGRTRAFIGIDQRPGTPLDRHLLRIIDQIPRQNGVIDPEDAIQFVTQRTNDFIQWAEGGAYGDGRPTLPWDKAVRFTDGIWDTYDQVAKDDPAVGLVRGTGERAPVVALERYIELGLGYCIQKSLLGALILDRLGIPARVVNGALDISPGKTSGHTWIELEDGRAIDPGWRTIVPKSFDNSMFPDRFFLSDCYRFSNQNYPILVLEGPIVV